jgi:glycosyltransferase involved in cell wall biosynthesis
MTRARARKLDRSTTLSIVIPVYDEEPILETLFQRITKVADELPVSVEILLVNDGSRDHSLEVMCSFVERDPRFRVVDLSRNFGNQYALAAAFQVVRGDVVAIVDADLQDPPEILARMLERWAVGVDVVYGQRRSREGEGAFKLLTAKLFYRLLSRVSSVEIPRDTGDFRVADRRVIDIINAMPERHPFLRGLFAWVGFRQEPFPYDRHARVAGTTKYPLRRMLVFSVDGLLSFSMKPLRWMVFLGLSMTVVSFVSGLYLLALRFLHPSAFSPGFAGMFVAMLFMFGINFICLGVIGEYVGRSYVNVQGRPPFIVRAIVENVGADDDPARRDR